MMGDEFLLVIEMSRKLGFIPGDINSTFIVMILNTSHPHTFFEFKPISLCNVLYKIISKAIFMRMKGVLSSRISTNQYGLLQGRSIQNAVASAYEVLHSI